MELNAAVLSKRGRKVIEKEMRFNFERVFYIVDSETVLNMINMQRPALVLRCMKGSEIIGEIQAATNGDVFCWAWISGHINRTDGLTRGRTPDELNKESHWWNGPLFCTNPYKTTGASSVGYRRKNHSQGGKWSVVRPQSQNTPCFYSLWKIHWLQSDHLS